MPGKLNKEEIKIGILQALSWIFFSGIWSILSIPLSGFLWALGGAENSDKNFRRVGVPIVICVACALGQKTWIPLVSILPFWGINTIGYGIPSWNGPDGTMDDEGAPLGQFWYLKCNNGKMTSNPSAEKKANIFTRITLAILYSLVMIPLVVINPLSWIFGAIILIIGYYFICK